MDNTALIWADIQQIRTIAPLIHNITNYVVMNSTANALLAIGASPVMAHANEEVEEMAGIASALVINIGTLSEQWIAAMFKAGQAARQRGIPVVLDPVGCGATKYRTDTAREILRIVQPTVVRGNASEIRALIGRDSGTRGVDSVHTPDDVAEDARRLAASSGAVVSVSGPVDIITDGSRSIRIANGHPMMTRVTGMGCTASALTGAFCAVNTDVLQGAASAMAVMGIAGEMAAERSGGPGSFQVQFLDVLGVMGEGDISERLSMRGG